jgi:hypothetical protein
VSGNLCRQGHANAAGTRFCGCGCPTEELLGAPVLVPVGAMASTAPSAVPVMPAPAPAVAVAPPPPPPPPAPVDPTFVAPRPVTGFDGGDGAGGPLTGVTFGGPQEQRRWTVALRWLLALPQFVWCSLLSVVAVVAVTFGWIAALVTGRLPEGIRHFVGRVVNQWTAVFAYGSLLMTDRHPPFSLNATDYEVQVVLHPPTRLNRAAVLFRAVLAIPALILMQLMSYGISAVMLFVWVVVLVSRRQPRPVFEATAAMLRYIARSYAYVFLLTPTQPRDLLGDGDSAAPGWMPAPEAQTGLGRPAVPRLSRLVLSRPAKQLVVLTMVVGALTGIGLQTTNFLGFRQRSSARASLDASYGALGAASMQFGSQAQACGVSGGQACLVPVIADYRVAVERFLQDLQGTALPPDAVGPAQALEQQTMVLLNDLTAMTNAPTPADFVAAAQQFQADAFAADAAYEALADALLFG